MKRHENRSIWFSWIVVGFFVMAGALLAAPQTAPAFRSFSVAKDAWIDFEPMLDDLAKADIVLIGEQHDDAAGHNIERQILGGIGKRRDSVVLSLEMFERDVQEPLDHFSMGHIDEPAFLKDARPWPPYATDYKPLLDLAIDKSWPVIAANVPRSIAADVSKSGLDALASKSDAEKKWFAKDLQCPTDDDYFKRFGEAMGPHPGAGGDAAPAMDAQTVERYYFAQCVKDETMAESIADAYSAGAAINRAPIVVHYTGAFHADYHEGTTARVVRRLPAQRVVTISIVPDDPRGSRVLDKKQADWVIFEYGVGGHAPSREP
jgi:uncharacterized iron-regulated protein